MINRLQLFLEQVFHHSNVLERNRTFLEETFGHLTIYYLVNQCTDAFFRIFLQTS